jgi:hypothetical protein
MPRSARSAAHAPSGFTTSKPAQGKKWPVLNNPGKAGAAADGYLSMVLSTVTKTQTIAVLTAHFA